MTKSEACNKLAYINEKISEIEDLILDIESRLRWDDESRKDWYLERKAELSTTLEVYKQEHNEFISEYGDIIYS